MYILQKATSIWTVQVLVLLTDIQQEALFIAKAVIAALDPTNNKEVWK